MPAMTPVDPRDLVEIYHTDSRIAAQKILDVILAPEGIEGFIHDRMEAMFPGFGKTGGLYIAVRRTDKARAQEIIAQAEADGVLDVDEGEEVKAPKEP